MNLIIKGVTTNAKHGTIGVDVSPSQQSTFDVHVSVMMMRSTGLPSMQFRVVPLPSFDMRDLPEAYSEAADIVADLAEDAAKTGISLYAYLQQMAMTQLRAVEEGA